MMNRQAIAAVLALSILCPASAIAADDPTRSSSPTQSAKQPAAPDSGVRKKLGWTLVAVGTAAFVYGLGHRIVPDQTHPTGGYTHDATAAVSGFAVASVGAILLWKAPVHSAAAPSVGTVPLRQADATAIHWHFHP